MINLRTQNARATGVSAGRTMKWHCVDCFAAGRSANFEGPTDHSPEGGCPVCASHQIFDCNVTPVTLLIGGQG